MRRLIKKNGSKRSRRPKRVLCIPAELIQFDDICEYLKKVSGRVKLVKRGVWTSFEVKWPTCETKEIMSTMEKGLVNERAVDSYGVERINGNTVIVRYHLNESVAEACRKLKER
ncbi:MAG: hypothetical protein WC180_02865 [Candidatus Paceibacterota bacterium]|jgi:hypothetical protein